MLHKRRDFPEFEKLPVPCVGFSNQSSVLFKMASLLVQVAYFDSFTWLPVMWKTNAILGRGEGTPGQVVRR